jgi:signal transduction histidine kinase/ActR/RegA family two-component response regulator
VSFETSDYMNNRASPVQAFQVPLQTNSRPATPFAYAGLGAVLLLLTGFALWVAFSTKTAAERATLASQMSDKYDHVSTAVAAEESLERKYRLEPGPEIAAQHHDQAVALIAGLQSIAQTGDDHDREVVQRTLITHERYLEATRRMFAAVDAGDNKKVIAIDEKEVDPVFSLIEREIEAAATHYDRQTSRRLSDLTHTESVVVIATPIVFTLGLFLLGWFWRLLRSYQWRIDAANQREVEGIKADAEAEVARITAAAEMERQTLSAHDSMRAKEHAERASQAKSDFLSGMSHELRTPLNAVLGFGQVLEIGDLNEDQREAVSHILKGGHHLLGLINELLDIARVESGQIELSLEPVAVSDLAFECFDLVRPLALSRNLRLEYLATAQAGATCPYVMADKQRLKQVLLNLLSNAVKYNTHGGSITVNCLDAQDPTRLRIRVTDTGPGIPEDQQLKLFIPFERLGADRTDTEGTGLGLALSHRLVGAMAGSMGVESASGKGSTFWVELPVALAPAEHLTEDAILLPPPTSGLAKPVTILYIEDNLANLTLVERILSRRPEVKLLSAMQGGLGLELAHQHQPDLILLDLHLPDVRGDEVLARLRANPRTATIPVVMLSADAMSAQKKRLLGAGACDYLTKPIDVREFLRLVDDIKPSSLDRDQLLNPPLAA